MYETLTRMIWALDRIFLLNTAVTQQINPHITSVFEGLFNKYVQVRWPQHVPQHTAGLATKNILDIVRQMLEELSLLRNNGCAH